MSHKQISWEESEDYFTPTYCWKGREGTGIVDMIKANARGKKRCAGGNYISSSPDDPVGPEKALLCAVIERAARDLFDDDAAIKQEAKAWFTRSAMNEGLSFAWICEQLGYDRGWFLSKLVPYVAEQLEEGEEKMLRVLRELGTE